MLARFATRRLMGRACRPRDGLNSEDLLWPIREPQGRPQIREKSWS